jgi:Uma2 family endonuclease
MHFGSDVVVPDWAGWRVERLPRIPAAAFLTLAPDWICEILSASTERIDRVKKVAIYAREGVQHVWLVNPLQRTLEILKLDQGRWVVSGSYAGDSAVRAEPFDAIELDLTRLWAASPPLEEPGP